MPSRHRPMPEAEFWPLIALLDGEPHGPGVGTLTEELRRRGKRPARAFAERLAAVLFDLDREVLAERTIRWADAPDEEPIPLSDDSFLYLRAAVVAAGPDAVAAVVADPGWLETRLWCDGEELLYAADEAIGDQIETAVSYETGSNEQHWTARPQEDAPTRPVVALLTKDALDTIEGWDGDGRPMVMEMIPTWIDEATHWRVADDAVATVTAGGGLPDPDLDQLVVVVRFDREDGGPPTVRARFADEFGGLVTEGTITAAHARARAWTRDELGTALGALTARVLLACLPADHGGRPALQTRLDSGADLLHAT